MKRCVRRRGMVLFFCATLAALAAIPAGFASQETSGASSPGEPSRGAAGNRLTYLDSTSPFYVGAGFPRLATPMWIGEEGVDAAIILSIDDLRENGVERYRDFLAPVLARLKEVQGYSPLDIFANRVDPSQLQLQTWIDAGVRCEVHTRTHPCPLLGGSLDSASAEVFDCLNNLNDIPNHESVAFRMPCTDSINSSTPLFFTEILPGRTAAGTFLAIDSSISVFPDSSYEAYAPFTNYATTIKGYPYPWVIARLLWEFPIVVPTDWQAQNRRGVNHPETVAEMKRAMDKVILAEGLYTWCFHPHGWIRNDQIVEVIDHVVETYGSRVLFLNAQEVLARLNANLLGGVPLRAEDGADNGVRLLDVNDDGYMDVVIGNAERRETRLWEPQTRRWRSVDFPWVLVQRRGAGGVEETGVRFGVLREDGYASALIAGEHGHAVAHFDGDRWIGADPEALSALRQRGRSDGRDRGVRLRDVDGDGFSDLIVNNAEENTILRWSAASRCFEPYPHALPVLGGIADGDGRDGGLRFWDVDGDGRDDVVFSGDHEYGVYLYETSTRAWTRRVLHGPAGAPGALPQIVREGRNRGAWFKGGALYVANEETASKPDLVEVRRFDFMLEHMAPPPLEAAAALETFELPAGFRIELVAAEPQVMDPVSIEFGPDGRVWVAEMGSYPDGRGQDAEGRIRLLRDRDGDGRLEESSVFARGLSFPSGALPFRRGVLVTCAPDILYLEDSDGDDRADVRRVVFTGFGAGNQQHRVNGLHFGIDNWIYGANGDSGGTIRAIEAGGDGVDIGRRDFRFRADLRQFEAVSGNTQFGLAMDDFGNRFGASNSRHILHAVLPERYLRRNPYATPPRPVVDIAVHGAMAPIFPISKQLLSLNAIHVPGRFSSACGISIYRGAAFPAAYRGSAYVAEPVGNLVHRDVLEPAGATFRASRAAAEESSEFLASRDSWFRPVYTATGPDGALYVVDMYRYVIEHPAYIPVEIQQILDITAGRDRGRIYRVVYDGDPNEPQRRPEAAFPNLTHSSTDRLVRLLEHPGGWWRDAAQRLLLERRDVGVAAELRRMAAASPLAASRVHALWTLDGLELLDAPTTLRALGDPAARVREHALRLAEGRAADDRALAAKVLSALDDPDFRVRLQAAFSLGEIAVDGAAAADALAGVLRRDGADAWMRAAVVSSSSRYAGRLLARFISAERHGGAALDAEAMHRCAAQLVEMVTRQGDAGDIGALLEALVRTAEVARWHVTLLGALAAGGHLETALNEVARGGRLAASVVREAVQRVRSHARQVALDGERERSERIEAIALLGPELVGDPGTARRLLSARQAIEVQVATVRALASTLARAGDATAETLVASWKAAGPVLRGEILQELLAHPAGTSTLLAALERGAIARDSLDAPSRERLLASDAAEVRRRAQQLLERPSIAARRQVVATYAAGVARLQGVPERGRAVFLKHCATCHRVGEAGVDVGPPPANWGSKDTATLLESILNPGGAVPPRYTSYVVNLRSGRVATGLITTETARTLTLLRPGGIVETILRADVADLTAASGSLMPAELETAISIEAMADLVSFLRQAP